MTAFRSGWLPALLRQCLLTACVLALGAAASAAGLPVTAMPDLPDALDADSLDDWRCLREAYPRLQRMVEDAAGLWLVFDDGRRVLYAARDGRVPAGGDSLVTDVRSSMAQAYPLEPDRPPTPPGFAPGRRRSYDLLHALYGSTAAQVRGGLLRVHLLGQAILLSQPAAEALRRVAGRLEPLAAADPALSPWLKSDGGFTWRRIAGEQRLSPHSFGIALDLSPGRATYWRWCRLMPHPLQRTYPAAIVAAMEREGFIWGGKWHEYDLMHFEYRPELICKARLRRQRAAAGCVPAGPAAVPRDLPMPAAGFPARP